MAAAAQAPGMRRRESPIFTEELVQLKESHDTAYVFVDQAICFEEAGRPTEALDMYMKGLKYLDEGLAIRLDLVRCSDAERETSAKTQRKLERMRNDVHERISVLSAAKPESRSSRENRVYPDLESECPPSYSEATSSDGAPAGSSEWSERQMSARELLHIPFGVQVFHVNNNTNEVSVQNDPTELHIYTLNKAYQPVGPQTVSWISTGEFSYPLIPKKSPVLKTGYGAYVFPDVHPNNDAAASVAIVLSADIPDDIRAHLDDILEDYAAFRKQRSITVTQDPEDVPVGQKIADGIVSVSSTLSRAMVKGAQATSVALNYGAGKLKERINPDQEAAVVDPRVQTGLKVARVTTHVTCKVTGFVVGAVGDMTAALGRRIANTISPPDAVDGSARTGALNDALLIAGGGLTGIGNLFMGLENAGKVLAQSITTNTVTLVDHKYGRNAGEVVGDALYSVGNCALTANNVKNLGIRGIAKRTAKETGRAVLEQYAQQPPTYTVEEPEDTKAGPSQKT